MKLPYPISLILHTSYPPITKYDSSNISASALPNAYGYVNEGYMFTVAANSDFTLRNSIIYGCGGGYSDGLNIITDGVTINDCEFIHCYAGIRLEDSNGHTINNCNFSNFGHIGITLDTSINNIISNCTFI